MAYIKAFLFGENPNKLVECGFSHQAASIRQSTTNKDVSVIDVNTGLSGLVRLPVSEMHKVMHAAESFNMLAIDLRDVTNPEYEGEISEIKCESSFPDVDPAPIKIQTTKLKKQM